MAEKGLTDYLFFDRSVNLEWRHRMPGSFQVGFFFNFLKVNRTRHVMLRVGLEIFFLPKKRVNN